MNRIKAPPYFSDVDDTIVIWDVSEAPVEELVEVLDPFNDFGAKILLWPNKPMIEMIKTKKARGSYVTVWSAGGEAWANAVVNALGLTEFVDATMDKPHSYGDDLPCEKWMGERIFISPQSKWRNNG